MKQAHIALILLYLMRINKLPLNVMEKDFIVELRKLKKIWKDSVYYKRIGGKYLFAFVVYVYRDKDGTMEAVIKKLTAYGFMLKMFRKIWQMMNIIHIIYTNVLLIGLNKFEMNGINKMR